ncbi:MBL fold metallo-hydrolase [Fictibacillus phosphorivorans]|uniref:MBL fold metallo-hydrolase n=1 Tax=Fictibacillus phosphorivorans TaxID=1221500 RepID=UPI00203C11CC|nr:MBL fold metallo-hydrolase [Fictibacillus phosphorivorans]MCM3776683.1 MBL fold metallo-hydrolase [Fictibacillus phosphorivorans]
MQTLEKLSDRFWYQTPVSETDRPILSAVIGNELTLMIDAGNSENHATYFLEELNKNGIKKPSLAVITHWHWDHIFGMSALDFPTIASCQTKEKMKELIPFSWNDDALDERVKQGIEIEFCANAIKKEFKENRDIHIKLPTVTFDEKMEIDLGGVTCVLQHVGGDHTTDSIVIYIKEEKILFLADSLYANMYAPQNNYTVSNAIKLLDVIDSFDAETYILSHGGPISKTEYRQEANTLRRLADLTESCKGKKEAITDAYRKSVGRELNEDEMDTIQYFVNGYELYR